MARSSKTQLVTKTAVRDFIKAAKQRGIRSAKKMPDIDGLALGEARALNAAVLFVDLRGSTVISQNYSLDQQLIILHAYLGAATEVVKRSGAFLEKYTGDGLMAVFGHFEGSKDTPSVLIGRSIEVAQGVIDTVRQSVNPVLNELGLPTLRCAAGLDYGTVAIVHTGIRGENDMVTLGATANLAAKIEGRTPAWKIGVGHDAHALLWPDDWFNRWLNYKKVNDYKYYVLDT